MSAAISIIYLIYIFLFRNRFFQRNFRIIVGFKYIRNSGILEIVGEIFRKASGQKCLPKFIREFIFGNDTSIVDDLERLVPFLLHELVLETKIEKTGIAGHATFEVPDITNFRFFFCKTI